MRELLAEVASQRLRLVVAAVADPAPYLEAGLYAMVVADDPLLDLDGFTLGGKSRSGLRHSVSAARRAGLRIVGFEDRHWPGVQAVSASWLAGKRGGEMGFTLGRVKAEHLASVDTRVAVDRAGNVCGFCTWRGIASVGLDPRLEDLLVDCAAAPLVRYRLETISGLDSPSDQDDEGDEEAPSPHKRGGSRQTVTREYSRCLVLPGAVPDWLRDLADELPEPFSPLRRWLSEAESTRSRFCDLMELSPTIAAPADFV